MIGHETFRIGWRISENKMKLNWLLNWDYWKVIRLIGRNMSIIMNAEIDFNNGILNWFEWLLEMIQTDLNPFNGMRHRWSWMVGMHSVELKWIIADESLMINLVDPSISIDRRVVLTTNKNSDELTSFC